MALTTLTVRVDQEELDFLDRLALQHEGILSKQGVVRLLLQHAQAAGWDPLDRSATLGVQSAAGTPSTSSSSIPKSINTKENKNKGRKQNKYPDAFEAFWRAYQQLPQKASKQSKPLALVAWQDVVEFTPEADLQRAVELQLEVQHRELQSERGFTVAMPDCFRWLRDECFVALLEGHTAAQPQQQFTYL